MQNIPRILRTVRPLRPRQIAGQLRARLPHRSPASTGLPATAVPGGAWTPGIPKHAGHWGGNRFRFLNVEADLEEAGGWFGDVNEYLWYYNLNYFEWINAGGFDDGLYWISRWIAENPPGSSRAWDPYPVSLRIINWIRYALEHPEVRDAAFSQSLAYQARWLSRRLETHLLANHYLVNGIALLFAGAFFHGREPNSWLETGWRILRTEVPEQVLADGGHFERSPMYHSLVLEDLLNVVNLTRTFPERVSGEIAPFLFPFLEKMFSWLRDMGNGVDRFPLFNDAAFGIASSFTCLESYARTLDVPTGDPACESVSRVFAESGFARLQSGPLLLFADVGGPGPSYQPGHCHAGTLGFELWCREAPLIVDTGTGTYENGKDRIKQRSTSAHNTLDLNGIDSSEVWSSFRVGRRASVIHRKLQEEADGRFLLEADHDGYSRVGVAGPHRRTWTIDQSGVTVEDLVVIARQSDVVVRFHFHPDVGVQRTSEYVWEIRLPKTVFQLEADSAFNWSQSEFLYSPEFGLFQAAQVLVGRKSASGPARCRIILSLLS